MSKLVLTIFCLLALGLSSNLRTPEPDTELFYSDVEKIIAGFMQNYTNTNYNMSECLTVATQHSLDQILAASVGYMVILDFTEVLDMYKEFLTQMAIATENCGLIKVSESLTQGLKEKGEIWFAVNLAMNSETAMKLMEAFATQIKAKNYVQAGQILGKVTSILVPYDPVAPALLGEILSFNQAAYQSWWKGLVIGLSRSTKTQGPCAKFLLNFANTTIAPADDISMLLARQMAGFKTLFGDMATSLTFVQTNNTGMCQFEVLQQNIIELFGKNGPTLLLSRYAERAMAINTAIVNIEKCNQAVFTCGEAYGTIIKYMLDWSIN